MSSPNLSLSPNGWFPAATSGITEFEVVQAFLYFVKPQEQSTILVQQLPGEPTAYQDYHPGKN